MERTDTSLRVLPGLLRRLGAHLSPRRRVQLGLLGGLSLAGAFAEVVSLGAVLPFLGVLVAPERTLASPVGGALASALGVTTPEGLARPVTLLFIAAALLTAGLRTLLLWASTRLAFACGADLSLEAYRRTLYQPYSAHVAQNSAEVIGALTKKLEAVAYGVLLPLLTLVGSTVLLLSVGLAFFAVDPGLALAVTAVFGGVYGAISWVLRRRLERNSRLVADANTSVIKALQEGLGGIRDVLIDGSQPVYVEAYRRADRTLRRTAGDTVFLSGCPRFVIEAVVMTVIAAVAYAVGRRPGGLATALPILGALAVGAQRLLPALQQGYAAWAAVVGTQASLADTLEMLERPLPPAAHEPPPPPLPFEREIRLKGVRFRYAPDGPWVLDGLDLSIPKGARVGLVGATGGGKSTALDLVMGLLEPTEGEVLVDGRKVAGDAVRAWQRTLAHVPQAVFLADASLAENIAFGVPRAAVDMARVREAARLARIADFIESRPEGYEAKVGERGVRLSGGQRQRIGIARALYKKARVLVFDEATSALDNATEKAVMEEVGGLGPEITVLLIAHRLGTVRRCGNIVELGAGRVVAQGTYEELLEKSPSFRAIARTGEPA